MTKEKLNNIKNLCKTESIAEYLIQLGNEFDTCDPPTLNRVMLLMYYAQIWSICMNNEVLFDECIKTKGFKVYIPSIEKRYIYCDRCGIVVDYDKEYAEALEDRLGNSHWSAVYEAYRWFERYSTIQLLSWANATNSPLAESFRKKKATSPEDIRKYMFAEENINALSWFDKGLKIHMQHEGWI